MGIRLISLTLLLLAAPAHAHRLVPCPVLFAIAASQPELSSFERFLQRPALRRYLASPGTLKLRATIARGGQIEIAEPFRYTGSAQVVDGVLNVVVYFIGSNRPPEPKRGPSWWNIPGWYLQALQGQNTHRALGRFDPTFAMVMTGLFGGVNDYLARDAGIHRVVIDVPAVQNGSVAELFQQMGFLVYRQSYDVGSVAGGNRSTGLGLRLEFDVPTP